MTYGKTVAEAEIELRVAGAGVVGFVNGLLLGDSLSPKMRELAQRLIFEYDQARFALKHAHTVQTNRTLHVPYAEFCHHPEKCAGLSICPRDPVCCD